MGVDAIPSFLTSADLAERLGVTVQTVWRWRTDGIGPRWVKIGGTVRYPVDDFLRFLIEQGAMPAESGPQTAGPSHDARDGLSHVGRDGQPLFTSLATAGGSR